MNVFRPQRTIAVYIFRFSLYIRRFLPRRKCFTFSIQKQTRPKIEKIYVINLDREVKRWTKIKQELRRILDSSGAELLTLAERFVAVDGNELSHDLVKNAEIDPFYTLEEQLFVEPQPSALPTCLELDSIIQISRAEYAVARSHIGIWKQIAKGHEEYVLILEDDVWFHLDFARELDKVWNQVFKDSLNNGKFDVLYLSYLEVKHGAPKTLLSKNVFKPLRGLWHLSGYVLSKKGAEKLLSNLPCRGPVDLWINHKFEKLNVLASKHSIIGQRRDTKSTNSYSILPTLTKIGAITSEGASLFNIRPLEQPVFVFGPLGSGYSSLAMALSMLGYTCCSDLKNLPVREMDCLLRAKRDRVFNAYVNIGTLQSKIKELRIVYPKAKFILTTFKGVIPDEAFISIKESLVGVDLTILDFGEMNKWRILCGHLRCAPPASSYPMIKDVVQRTILIENNEFENNLKLVNSKRDSSPWVVEPRKWWHGIQSVETAGLSGETEILFEVKDTLEFYDAKLWHLRRDTFTDNLALFRPSNISFISGIGAKLTIKNEYVGVREYTAASLCSQDSYLYGRFEATLKVSNVPGVVTGLFLHRNSPRQEIDIEITGNRPDRLLVNVFYNPGGEGANFEYGFRGSPTFIDLGFDASKTSHRFAIEWSPHMIKWWVDGNLVHKRVIWDPTPIPDLPMTFHINAWVSRSSQLAGRINGHLLPSASIVNGVNIAANKTKSTCQENNTEFYFDAKDFNPNLFTQ